MKPYELFQHCRYYHGDSEPPYSHDWLRCLWDYERVWCEQTLNDEDGFLDKAVRKYIEVFPDDFNPNDNVPESLRALLLNRFIHWTDISENDELRQIFPNWYRTNYLNPQLDDPCFPTPNPDLLLYAEVAGFWFTEGRRIESDLRPGAMLRMVREPDNKYDSNAVALYFSDTKIGYIPKVYNKPIAQIMDNATTHSLHAHISSVEYGETNDIHIFFEILQK